MKKLNFIVILVFVCLNAFAQKEDKSYRIKITDNRNHQHTSYDYLFKNDSLKISGLSDYGDTKVDYFSKKLSKKEKKKIAKFIQTFPADSLQETYFDDFFSFGAITADHFPRVIELEYRKGLKQYKSKATNCYVDRFNKLFLFLNQFIPLGEVKINFVKTEFKKHF
jgi:hypothetical protein